jgi:DNA primase
LVNSWYKECYKFEPVSNQDLNKLILSCLYTKEELLTIDPREIDTHMEFIETVQKNIDIKDLNSEAIKLIKGLRNLESTLLVEQLQKIAESLKPTANTIEEEQPTFLNLSERQLYVLKKVFTQDIILRIDSECTKKQINAIMGKIKKNDKFDIEDYLKHKSYSSINSNAQKEYHPFSKVSDNGNFTPIYDVEDVPF